MLANAQIEFSRKPTKEAFHWRLFWPRGPEGFRKKVMGSAVKSQTGTWASSSLCGSRLFCHSCAELGPFFGRSFSCGCLSAGPSGVPEAPCALKRTGRCLHHAAPTTHILSCHHLQGAPAKTGRGGVSGDSLQKRPKIGMDRCVRCPPPSAVQGKALPTKEKRN